MPKKGKRSQAQKERWMKLDHSNHTQLVESDPQSSREVKLPELSSADRVIQSGESNGPQVSEVCYADAVQKGCQSEDSCLPGPSHADDVKRVGKSDVAQAPCANVLKLRQHDRPRVPPTFGTDCVNLSPVETCVPASRSQASSVYGRSSNKQCSCNSLVFLAFLHENGNLTCDDLNLVLDKGNVMYNEIRSVNAGPDYLATDELPNELKARQYVYTVEKILSRYGSLGQPPPGFAAEYLALEVRLSCLLSDVRYALLVMSSLTIAVFRNRSGRYGFFDPHPRTARGVPSNQFGFGKTAVMVTFTHLPDMISRLLEYHNILHTQPGCQYELMPVEFHTVNIPSLNDGIPETNGGPVCLIAASPPVGEKQDHTISTDAQTESEPSTLFSVVSVPSGDVPHNVTESAAPRMNPDVTGAPNVQHDDHLSEHVTQRNMSKLNKQQRRKFYRRAMQSSKNKESQRKENKKLKQKNRYFSDQMFKEKKKFDSRCHYQEDTEYRQKKIARYHVDPKIKTKYQQYINRRYQVDLQFKQRRQQLINRRYQVDPQFREQKQQKMKKRYQVDLQFREQQQQYIKERYRVDPQYRKKQQQYVKERYQVDPQYRKKQQQYIKERYQNDDVFQRRQKSYITQRYANEPHFRLRQRQLMKQLMKQKRENNLAFRMTQNMRCAANIKRKYRQMNQQHNQTVDSDNPLITKAVFIFRTQIKNRPSYVCTVCHRALFPNQVRSCMRLKYEKNPDVVAPCLTGKYVHACSDVCINQQCKVPDERKKEWICHTCHDNLKRGVTPSLAVVNKLELAEIPLELTDLNILERHLIAKYITFAKIISLPKGRQRSVHGNVICVPAEIQETVDSLPRLRSESQVMRVKLKRRLCYRGHQLFQTVTWSKLMQALHTLKEIHPQYEDINIRDDPDLCDPTLNSDNDDSDDDDMRDDDFDEEDLMEIDRFEKNALCEAENDSDCEQQDIEIQLSRDSQPENHSNEREQEGDMPYGGVALESCLQPSDIAEEILCFSEGIYSVAPAEGNRPVSFFRTPKLEAMAFPVQFPTGQNTLDVERPIKLSPSSYFKSRLFCVDDRFARDPNYLFFAQFVIEIHLATSSMSIQLRKGKPVTKDGRVINSAMLQNKREVEKLVRNRDAVRFMQPLRGTPAYWQKTTKDLFAMIRQLGTPTFFCTFSAAEMRWPEVIEAIKAQQGEEVNFDELDWTTKCDILRSNPVTTMRMFDKRVEALFRDLILSPAEPIGKVVDYFYRLEFQHRGSPHIHCLMWVEGAPVFEEDNDKTVCDFVDRYITAQLPDPNTQPELNKIVTEVQTHSKNHSRSCRKNNSLSCRFGFPKPPCSNTMISRPGQCDDPEILTKAKRLLRPVYELLTDPQTPTMSLEQLLARCSLTIDRFQQCLHVMTNGCAVIMKRDPKDCWVNSYNPHLLKIWDANIDVQYILNAYSCIMYITSYITKAEHGLSEYLKTVLQNSSKDYVNESDEMKQIMQAYSKKREVSAQECVTRACGIHMKKSSRSVIFIPTDDNALRMSRPMSFIESTTPDSINIWMTGLTEKYQSRPERPDFEEMCLADFAATCRLVYGKQTRGKNAVPLLNELGYVQKRKNDKCAVIRYHRWSQEKNPEEFYGNVLKLYLPHRSAQQLKSQSFPTYESFHRCAAVQLPGSDKIESVKGIVNQNRKKYEKHSDEIESAIEEYEQGGGLPDEWCNLAPESELMRLECIEELEEREPDDENEQENVPDYIPQPNPSMEARVTREAPEIDSAVLRQMYQNLNQKQASVFYAVRDWCVKRVCGLNTEQFFLYINGGAGTGKSHLIQCIHSESSKILLKLPRNVDEDDISKPTVLLTAFTGTAAFNICGATLHSLLKLPRSLNPPFQGLGNQLDELRAELLNAEIIIIDEISMVSKPLFAYVDARLKQIKGLQRPFGGMSVLAVGDFYQLPPVRQAKPLCVYEPNHIDLWQGNFQMITLTEIMRQKGDIGFAEMLNRLRLKEKSVELSEEDRALLSQAITEPHLCPSDVLHIFATNKQVDQHNLATLILLHDHIMKIDADDYKKDPRTGRMTRQALPCQGTKKELPDTIQVAEGARVMITRNISVQRGVVNGSMAKLVRIVTHQKENTTHVFKLGLEMDITSVARSCSEKTGGQHDNLVYLERQEENLKQKGVVRRQFPLKLAFACTTHKVQGMSTTSAVVSLKRIFEPGMAYVALSRVTSLSGLHLLDMDEKKIYANPEITAALQTMTEASLDHVMPLLSISHTLNRQDSFIIVHHNTEGLPSHINDLKSHHELCLCDVLCLTETHLQGSFVADSLQLEGYTMFKRNRHVSYTNFSQLANRSGGGVAVYVKNHIQAREKQYIQNVTDLEFVAVKIEAPVNALIAVVYRPPSYCVRSFLSNLESLLESLEIIDHHPIIVCGDFNENLLSEYTSTPILELFQSRGYAQLITAATTEKNTLLDLIFISRPRHCLHSGADVGRGRQLPGAPSSKGPSNTFRKQ